MSVQHEIDEAHAALRKAFKDAGMSEPDEDVDVWGCLLKFIQIVGVLLAGYFIIGWLIDLSIERHGFRDQIKMLSQRVESIEEFK